MNYPLRLEDLVKGQRYAVKQKPGMLVVLNDLDELEFNQFVGTLPKGLVSTDAGREGEDDYLESEDHRFWHYAKVEHEMEVAWMKSTTIDVEYAALMVDELLRRFGTNILPEWYI